MKEFTGNPQISTFVPWHSTFWPEELTSRGAVHCDSQLGCLVGSSATASSNMGHWSLTLFFWDGVSPKKGEHHSQNYGKSQEFPLISQKWINIWMFAKSQIPKMGRKNWILPDFWLVDDGDWWMITCTEISLLRQSCIVCGGWNHQHTHLYIYTYVNHMYMIIYEHQATPFWRLKIS